MRKKTRRAYSRRSSGSMRRKFKIILNTIIRPTAMRLKELGDSGMSSMPLSKEYCVDVDTVPRSKGIPLATVLEKV